MTSDAAQALSLMPFYSLTAQPHGTASRHIRAPIQSQPNTSAALRHAPAPPYARLRPVCRVPSSVHITCALALCGQ